MSENARLAALAAEICEEVMVLSRLQLCYWEERHGWDDVLIWTSQDTVSVQLVIFREELRGAGRPVKRKANNDAGDGLARMLTHMDARGTEERTIPA